MVVGSSSGIGDGGGGGGGGGGGLGEAREFGGGRRAYRELRALRQLLVYEVFENEQQSVAAAARRLASAPFFKSMRASSVVHFLFNLSESKLLSSPYNHRNMQIEDYIAQVCLGGGGKGKETERDISVERGEVASKDVALTCCDEWKQRVGASAGVNARDAKVMELIATVALQ